MLSFKEEHLKCLRLLDVQIGYRSGPGRLFKSIMHCKSEIYYLFQLFVGKINCGRQLNILCKPLKIVIFNLFLILNVI